MTQDELKRVFTYKDGCLFWNVSRQAVKNGGLAGGLHSAGYKVLTYNQKQYKVHRLIFLMHHGYMPETIDHVDGDRANNKIENLRAVTGSQNQYNRKINENNTSGVKGVVWHKAKKRWMVRLSVDGKRKVLGYYKDFIEAEQVIKQTTKKIHGQYARQL